MAYTALTVKERRKAAQGGEDYFFNPATGGFTSRDPTSNTDERSLSLVDWLTSASAMVTLVRKHHGEARASALEEHHKHVTGLARTHGWPIALAYDIHQREAAADEHRHDLSTLDVQALTLTTSGSLLEAANSTNRPSLKRQHTDDYQPPTGPNKRSCPTGEGSHNSTSGRCFRCGHQGHMPTDCTNETTTAGITSPSLSTSSRSRNALVAANGKPYCFAFARFGKCKFASNCHNHHACSICNEFSHGAGRCPRAQ